MLWKSQPQDVHDMSRLLTGMMGAWLLITLSSSVAASALTLYTFNSPPYQIEGMAGNDSRPVYGATVDTIRCIARRQGWVPTIRSVPQNRALHGLRNLAVDGYFAVDASEHLDSFAVASAPIALEKWYFYSRTTIDDFSSARIAVITGSNEALWLEQSPYEAAMSVATAPQLLALLARDRIDAILMDQRVMATLINGAVIEGTAEPLEAQFIRFVPLHLYLNHSYTHRHPEFLPHFNAEIEACVNGGFTLTETESMTAEALARELVRELDERMDLQSLLSQPVRNTRLGEILHLDSQWQAHAPAMTSPLAREILALPQSRELARWQKAQYGLVTEVFLMDRLGANVAQSQLTSDYWQGDEHKFQRVVPEPAGTLFLSPVRFDGSAQRFQIQVSTPVRASSDGRFLGAVAIGLDIELVLRNRLPPPLDVQEITGASSGSRPE